MDFIAIKMHPLSRCFNVAASSQISTWEQNVPRYDLWQAWRGQVKWQPRASPPRKRWAGKTTGGADGVPPAPPGKPKRTSYLVATEASANALANSYTRLRTAESVMR